MNVQLESLTEKKKAIFESTLELIQEFGFHGTPMSEIANRANVAAGTIYHYFSSKDDLILELFKYVKTNDQEATFKQEDLTKSFGERFRIIWIRSCKFYMEHPEYLSFMEQFYCSPYLKKIKNDNLRDQHDFKELISLGAEKGYIKKLDVQIIASVFWGSITATAKRHHHGHHHINEENLSDLSGIIWDGLRI
ncbi:transcriptional regulator, TetR family [bacterium A37T11]|nr:transcriptional regulator, TetR family [bacterium A37T11]